MTNLSARCGRHGRARRSRGPSGLSLLDHGEAPLATIPKTGTQNWAGIPAGFAAVGHWRAIQRCRGNVCAGGGDAHSTHQIRSKTAGRTKINQLRNVKSAVLAAVKQDGAALEYAHKQCRRSHHVVLEALKQLPEM